MLVYRVLIQNLLMTFAEALAKITSLQTKGWRLGLDRMEEFLRRAGLGDALGHASGPHPQPLSTGVERGAGPQFIHVAGTNGKGSVTAFLQSMLVAQRYRTGATFSPFVYDVRERIQIDGELISEEQFAAITERLWPISVEMDSTPFEGPTEFEFKTAMGFAAWKDAGCEWVALETGLGGRLDATNVVTPACSVIVSIGYDHHALLGNTLCEIAIEKAGIIKQGRPVVVGLMDDEPLAAILQIAEERGSAAWVFGRDVQFGADWVEGPGFRYDGLEPGIPGAVQPHNLAVAIAAMHATGAVRNPSRIAFGASATRLPGRMEQRWVDGQLWILDGAHNAESAQSVVDSLCRWRPVGPETNDQHPDAGRLPAVPAAGPLPQPLSSAAQQEVFECQEGAGEGSPDAGRLPGVRVMMTGMLTGHDPIPFYSRFSGMIDEVHVVPIDFIRTRDPFELAEEIRGLFGTVVAHRTLLEAMSAVQGNGAVLVTGSFYLVGEVGNLLSKMAELGPSTEKT